MPSWEHEYDQDVCEHGCLLPNCWQGCLAVTLALRAEVERAIQEREGN